MESNNNPGNAPRKRIPQIAYFLFLTRWLQLPLYFGLVLAQCVYVFHFWVELTDLIGAVMGFLRFNFNPATIFLGDSGSLFLGFMAAVLSLVGAQKSPTLIAVAIPLISFGLPVVEVGISLSRRFVSGAPLFQGDRRHIHHMLLKRGLTQRQVVILLYVICALFTLFGLMLLNPQRNKVALILFVLGVGVVLGVVVGPALVATSIACLGLCVLMLWARRRGETLSVEEFIKLAQAIRVSGLLPASM